MSTSCALAAACALFVAAPFARAQSQNCSMRGQVGLVEGTYDIPIHATATATKADAHVTTAIDYSATIHLTIDKNGSTSAKGDATIDIHLTAALGAGNPDMHIDSSSSGPLEVSSSSMTNFTMVGVLKGTGTETSVLGGVSAAADGVEVLAFEILKASCESGAGTFKSKAFDGVVEGFKAKGFATTAAAGPGSWSVGVEGTAKAEVEAITAELKQIESGAGSDVGSDAGKLDSLLTKINGKSDNLKKCLTKFWREAAMHVMAKDLAPKIARLSGFPADGDPAALDKLFDDALAVDTHYVQLGLDSCTDGERPQFDILAAKTAALLTRAIQGGNTLQILAFEKQFPLLSGVESAGGTRGWTVVVDRAAKELKTAVKAVSAMLKTLPKSKGAPGLRCTDAAALQLLRVEAAAEQQLGILTGNASGQVFQDDAIFHATCAN